MIPRVISLKKSGATHGGFREVVEYVGRDGEDAREKGLESLDETACGVLNLDADAGTAEDREEIAEIMNATAMQSRRLQKNPAYHFCVNWIEGEHPTREQCEQTVGHFVSGLGMGECETFWAVHQDTDNDHVHVIVNTVHPERGVVVGLPRYDYRVLARLAREMELEQGWNRAAGYYVTVEPEPGQVQIMQRTQAIRRGLWNKNDAQRPPVSMAATRAEHNLGGESFQAWVTGKPAQALQQAIAQPEATWETAHAALAQYGVSIEPKGSGMVVHTTLEDGRVLAAKASQLGRWASKAELEKKLGPYHPAQQTVQPVEQTYEQAMRAQRIDSEPAQGGDDPGRAAKREARAAARKELGERFEKEQGQIRAGRRDARTALREQHQTKRRALRAELTAQWKQQRAQAREAGRDVTLERAIWAREAAIRLEALQKQQATQRKALTAGPRAVVWREWLEREAAKGDEAAQAALRGIRYREQRKKKTQDNAIEGEELESQQALTVASLQAEVDRRRMLVIYRSADGRERFVDTGPRIVMRDRQKESVDAALRVAAQKYGGQVNICGSAEFRERAARQAARLGIRVRDADLQVVVAHERVQMRASARNRGMSR